MPEDLVSIVIPVFNEAESLPTLIGEILDAMGSCARPFEVLFVDDGSRDSSREVLVGLARRHASIRVLASDLNLGQSAALISGFRAARGTIVATLDSDLQNDPADLPAVLAALEGHDMVSGVRQRRRDSWLKRLQSRIANRVRARVLGDRISDVGCSLKAYRAEVLRDLPVFDGLHRFLPALVRLHGARVREIPVNHRPRLHGQSKYGLHNRLWRGLADLCGVRWLQKRHLDVGSVRELGP